MNNNENIIYQRDLYFKYKNIILFIYLVRRKARSVVNEMGFYGIRQLNDIKVFQAEDAQQILTNALPQWA